MLTFHDACIPPSPSHARPHIVLAGQVDVAALRGRGTVAWSDSLDLKFGWPTEEPPPLVLVLNPGGNQPYPSRLLSATALPASPSPLRPGIRLRAPVLPSAAPQVYGGPVLVTPCAFLNSACPAKTRHNYFSTPSPAHVFRRFHFQRQRAHSFRSRRRVPH